MYNVRIPVTRLCPVFFGQESFAGPAPVPRGGHTATLAWRPKSGGKRVFARSVGLVPGLVSKSPGDIGDSTFGYGMVLSKLALLGVVLRGIHAETTHFEHAFPGNASVFSEKCTFFTLKVGHFPFKLQKRVP